MFAALFCTIGMIVNKDFPAMQREANSYDLGATKYYLVLVSSAVIWQVMYVGSLGLIFCVSSLFSGIITATFLPLTEVAAVDPLQWEVHWRKGVILSSWYMGIRLILLWILQGEQEATDTSIKEYLHQTELSDTMIHHRSFLLSSLVTNPILFFYFFSDLWFVWVPLSYFQCRCVHILTVNHINMCHVCECFSNRSELYLYTVWFCYISVDYICLDIKLSSPYALCFCLEIRTFSSQVFFLRLYINCSITVGPGLSIQCKKSDNFIRFFDILNLFNSGSSLS